jgi:hypothetical protein
MLVSRKCCSAEVGFEVGNCLVGVIVIKLLFCRSCDPVYWSVLYCVCCLVKEAYSS